MSNDNETVENAERVKAGDGMPLPLKEVFGELGKNWGWLLFAGIVSILLGAAILLKWPATGLVVIGVLVAIEMIIHGWSYVFMALAARKAHRIIAKTGA